jgi:hypothetical protein
VENTKAGKIKECRGTKKIKKHGREGETWKEA